MLVCAECGHLFEQPMKVIDRHGLDTPPYEVTYVCPSCYGQPYIEAFECAECGLYITDRYVRTDSGMIICDECHVVRHLYDDC